MLVLVCKSRFKTIVQNSATFYRSIYAGAIVYRSQATHKLGSLHLFNMLVQCRKRNRALGITGHLLYTEEVFVQCIEGPPDAVETLWRSLKLDDRHYNLELLSRGPETTRRFGDWSMAFSTYAHFNKYDIPGFFPVDEAGMSEAAQRCATVALA